MTPWVHVHDRVAQALHTGEPVVALETAVATHGLPAPHNIAAMAAMQDAVEASGARPAMCLAHGGRLHVGAPLELVEEVASSPRRVKASVRDLGHALVSSAPAGLTVSATLRAAHLAGIRVFATGGIGGVHLGAEVTGDVSADLAQIAALRVLTVCSGAKSVLDIPRTLEHLESLGVPTYAFGSDTFPAFYLRSNGMPVPCLDSPAEAADIARAHWALGLQSGLVLGNPLPVDEAIAPEDWGRWLERAREEGAATGVCGTDVTPFLLARVAEHSDGQTVRANMALLQRNARLAGLIAPLLQP